MGASRGILAACLVACCTAANPAYQGTAATGESDASAQPSIDASVAIDTVAGPVAFPDAAASADASAAAVDRSALDLARDQGGASQPVGCGTGTANVATIMGADGLAIDTDGTIYLLTDDTKNSYVGRIQPGRAFEPKWLTVVASPTTWGLALDSARHRLYVLVVDGPGALVAFDDIGGTPQGRMVVTGLSNPNDVVVDSGGTVYYTNQGDRHIYAVSVDGGPAVRLTSSPLGDAAQKQMPSALTLDVNEDLIVGLEPGGPLYKITLEGMSEQTRTTYGTWTGWANGLTFDQSGRLYVSVYDDVNPRDVVRLESDGTTKVITSGGRFSSLAFGRGALDCRDLYVTDPFGPMRRVHVADAF